MEQVERLEEAEHILSASMPIGADAGFFSDTGVAGGPGGPGQMGPGGNKKRRPSIGHKIGALVGLSKKSNSLTQLQGKTSSTLIRDRCLHLVGAKRGRSPRKIINN